MSRASNPISLHKRVYVFFWGAQFYHAKIPLVPLQGGTWYNYLVYSVSNKAWTRFLSCCKQLCKHFMSFLPYLFLSACLPVHPSHFLGTISHRIFYSNVTKFRDMLHLGGGQTRLSSFWLLWPKFGSLVAENTTYQGIGSGKWTETVNKMYVLVVWVFRNDGIFSHGGHTSALVAKKT